MKYLYSMIVLFFCVSNVHAHFHPPVSHEHSVSHDHDGFGEHSHRLAHANHDKWKSHTLEWILNAISHDFIGHKHTHPLTHSHSGIGSHTHHGEHTHVPGGGEHPFVWDDINHTKEELESIETGIPVGSEFIKSNVSPNFNNNTIENISGITEDNTLYIQETQKNRHIWYPLVVTQIEILDGNIKRVTACSNYPAFNINGKLLIKPDGHYVEISVENRVYEKPIWSNDTWVETCKTISIETPVNEIFLLAIDSGRGDKFKIKLSDGIWHRKYERIESRITYPYHSVTDGNFTQAWYQTPSAPTIPYKRKLTTMWSKLKRR